MLIVCVCLSPVAAAQKLLAIPSTIPPSSRVDHTEDFTEVVVPITSVRITPTLKSSFSPRPGLGFHLAASFGTGFCLDAACRFIVTNYHVATFTRTHKIEGEKIVGRYLATGPEDEGATLNDLPGFGAVPYTQKRDLAIFELRHSLPRHHGLTFSLDELQMGQEVDIYGYPKGMVNPFRKLTRFPATFKGPTTSGLLAFDYQLSAGKPIHIEGSSGGIVVDRKTEELVGILSASNETTAAAVPVQTLADFVSKVQPFLAQRIFPVSKEISPVAEDLYAKFAPPSHLYPKFLPLLPDHADGLQHRTVEPQEVAVLRQKAQLLADGTRNFIAVQGFAWGRGDQEPDAEEEYEVRVIDGVQRFRRYPEGKEELKEVPDPGLKGWVLPAREWSELPTMVGTELKLKVRQAPDAVMNGRPIKVFQYYASAEDNLCPFSAVDDYGLFQVSKTVAVACYGEVWTDEDTNIIRMSEHLELSDHLKDYKGWQDYRVVLTYGWLKQMNEPPRLVPLTILTEARDKKHLYWCRGHFTNYQLFSAHARLAAN
jgi:hypothetical protein